jgi:cytochrome c553
MFSKPPKHIVRLLMLLGSFMILAYVAKIYLTDPSFYKYGHYRADSVPEIASGTPLFQGAAFCQTCHDERLADWSPGTHNTVQCEVCHGTNQNHPEDGKTLIPVDTVRLCTLCHEQLPARPAAQPQIVVAEHPFPDEETEQCHNCHDPHSPGDGEVGEELSELELQMAATSEAPGNQPATAKKCAKCHGKQGEGKNKTPALAGLESAVFIERMNMYLSGERDNKKMAKYAKALSTEEIEELAEFYESLTAESPQ